MIDLLFGKIVQFGVFPDWVDLLRLFIIIAVYEIVFILHIRRVAQGRAHAAGTYGALVYGVNGIVVLYYYNSPWFIIIAMISGYIFGRATVKYDKLLT